MLIRSYNPHHHEQCLGLFDGNCPFYFDRSERRLFEACLNRLDQGAIIHERAAASSFFVVEEDQMIQACGGYYIKADEQAAVMAWGMVSRHRHHHGLGSQLLHYRIDHIREHHPNHEIRLDTSQHTWRFFERFGFRTTLITPDAYGPGLDRYDMVLQV